MGQGYDAQSDVRRLMRYRDLELKKQYVRTKWINSNQATFTNSIGPQQCVVAPRCRAAPLVMPIAPLVSPRGGDGRHSRAAHAARFVGGGDAP